MDTLTARPQLLKQANLSLIRRVIRSRGTATRAEIALETEISSTTIRALLTELLERGEIEPMGQDASSGGRKAERYRFRPNCCHGAAFCIKGEEIHALVVNLCGEIESITVLRAKEEEQESVITTFLDDLIQRRAINSIGVGGPGVVAGDCFWIKNKVSGEFYQVDIGQRLSARYGLPVVIENDINAIAIGFGRCYEKEFPEEGPEATNMAYLHFEAGCVSAGFLSGGHIIRGYRQFAGELGLIPMEDGRSLDEWMAEPMEDQQYCAALLTIIGWICGILNPQYVAVGGPTFRKHCLGPIGDGLSALFPGHMQAELLYAPDVWHDYHDGMASLTAGKLLDTVQFVKE